MSTSLDRLRLRMAGHDAVLADVLCERARCGRRSPPPPAPGWAQALYMPLETAAAGDWFLSFVARVEREYPSRVVPLLAAAAASAGDDATVRACDEACVRALLLRLQFAAQVAASKARAPDARLREAARAGDAAALHARIVYPEVEQAVIARARGHADGFAKRRRLAEGQAGRLGEALAAVYRDWLIPLSREVQVAWLLAHAARVGRQRPA